MALVKISGCCGEGIPLVKISGCCDKVGTRGIHEQDKEQLTHEQMKIKLHVLVL